MGVLIKRILGGKGKNLATCYTIQYTGTLFTVSSVYSVQLMPEYCNIGLGLGKHVLGLVGVALYACDTLCQFCSALSKLKTYLFRQAYTA